MSLGPTEILVVLVVALIVLGPDKLPQAARSVARGYRDLKAMTNSFRSQVESALDIEDSNGPPVPPNPVNPDLDGFKFVDEPPKVIQIDPPDEEPSENDPPSDSPKDVP